MAFPNTLLVAVLCGTLWALAAAQPGDDCPQFWSYYAGSCYTLIHNPSTWAAAEEICKDFRAYLAEIEDDLENTFVKGLVDAANVTGMARYWIGGNDLLSESAWMWSHSGQDVQFTDWSPGNPSNSGHTENCLEIIRATTKPISYQWNDNKCSAHQYFVCEKGYCRKYRFVCTETELIQPLFCYAEIRGFRQFPLAEKIAPQSF